MRGTRSLASSARPLPGQDGVHNAQAGQSGDVIDDVVDLQIHLCQRLVQVLHVLAGRCEQFAPVSQ